MQLMLFRHLWGVEEPWEEAFPRIKAAGYHGIEAGPPRPEDEARWQDLLAAYEFAYIADFSTIGEGVQAHLDSFAAILERAKKLRPLLANVHSGRDSWRQAERETFCAGALAAERALEMPICHETHRGRMFNTPWATADLLQAFPDLRLSCDYSHWVCVAERLLPDAGPILELSARHCLHIHARVGYEEGPQVPDPRAPEYAAHLAAHESWWDLVWEAQAARGMQVSTLTPEFGPPPYQHTLPYSGERVGNLNEICDWQAAREAARFRTRYAG
jgi:hypothetical protein